VTLKKFTVDELTSPQLDLSATSLTAS